MSFNTTSFIKRRKLAQNSAFALFRIFSYSIVVILFFILGFILIKGFGVINWDFITQAPSDGMIFAFPIGIMSGIYMSEYARSGKLVNFIRTMTNNLAGIPSIVFGLFGMAFFVNRLDFGDSILAGSLTLGLLALPIIIRTTEETFKDIPNHFREGSLALGATKAQTIWNVLLPMATPRVITGLILSLGRVSGETAPILFTCAAYFLPKLPTGIFDQCMALPYHLYVVATSGTDIEAQEPIAYGTAFVLIVIVLIMNLAANGIRNHFDKKIKLK